MTRQFTYRFITSDDTVSYSHIAGQIHYPDNLPDWTKLEFNQCEGCQWHQSDRCPVAVGLIEPSKLLGKLKSYEPITVEVESPERIYRKETTVQEGLSSLFGLVMASSGCPSFKYLKGIAQYHLPFASFDETLFRVLSGYFIYLYLQEEQPLHDEIIDEIRRAYDQIKLTNIGITHRLREGVAPNTDSPMNAIVILDSFGSLVPMSAEDGLEQLKAEFF